MPERRTRNVMFWVNNDEYELIRKKMKQAGTINMSAYLRKMAIDGYVVKLDIPELRELTSLLGRLSGNVNQIARRVNSTYCIYSEDVAEIRVAQKSLCELLGKVIERLVRIT